MAKGQEDGITILLGLEGYIVGKAREGDRGDNGGGKERDRKGKLSSLQFNGYIWTWAVQTEEGTS